MAEIVGVRFKDVGKVYYFSPGGLKIPMGGKVIVETAHGVEYGEVVIPNKEVDDSEITPPLKNIMRTATPRDTQTLEANRKKEAEILHVFTRKIEEHKLTMKPIGIDCTFDGSKILFYFTAESRVDFRELVKDLASIYRTRIELRQIGVRDEAKMLGGLGVCGRGLCCSSFLGEFQPVSIKMAKEQSLSLNPTKISGTCGRLMCCLKYEQDTYEELLKITPTVGAYVECAEGRGMVEESNLLTGKLKIKLDKNKDAPPVTADRKDVRVIREAQIRLERDEINALKGLED
ncbi:MAG: stage 0 sporulation family protein [Oscillospiraceae bacterium]|nr:stage 0 sporulation family protein [Oscillospiraceae bacterium]